MAQKHKAPVLWARSQQVPSTQKLVLLCLALRANADWQCWPSIPQLCEDSGLKPRAISKALEALSNAGLIAIGRRYKQSNTYVLCPALDAAQKKLQLLSARGAAQTSPYLKGYNKGWHDAGQFKQRMGMRQ